MKEKDFFAFCWGLAALMGVVGGMFVYKYGVRVTGLALPASFVYAAAYAVGAVWVSVSRHRLWDSGRLMVAALALVSAAMLALLFGLDPMANNVDRWSAIHNFLEYMLSGRYPYAAPTHLGGYGSPFPAWQIFHLPFYLVGNVGLSMVVCLWAFVASLWRTDGARAAFKGLVLLSASLPLWYEVAVVSDLLPNMMLLAAYLNWFRWRVGRGPVTDGFLLANAAVCGLFASTRLLVGIPIGLVMYGVWVRQSAAMKVALPVVMAVVWALTFVPFVFWNGQMLFFFEYSPFVLQTGQGGALDIAFVAVVMAAACLWWCRTRQQVMAASAFAFVAFITCVFADRMACYGFTLDFWGSAFDHTYFSTCLPFAAAAVVIGNKE